MAESIADWFSSTSLCKRSTDSFIFFILPHNSHHSTKKVSASEATITMIPVILFSCPDLEWQTLSLRSASGAADYLAGSRRSRAYSIVLSSRSFCLTILPWN